MKIYNNSNYKKTNIKKYQYLIVKLIYLLYKIRPNIFCIVKQLNEKNINF